MRGNVQRAKRKGDDNRWMARAIELARRGQGCTRPNPPVGAVVVRDGRIVGEGWHRRAGLPHAEVEAIRDAGTRSRGATIYVTLEPCCTTGRTPPCTDLLIRKGVKRVVAGCADPNPHHAGRGFQILRRADIACEQGVLGEECRRLIEPFAMRLLLGRPFVTLKLALTLDGRLADRAGASRWITGPQARAIVQEMRRQSDAIMVGVGTVVADDPALRCRLRRDGGMRWRVVVDGQARTPPKAQVLTDAWADTTILVTSHDGAARRADMWAASGASVWSLPTTANGGLGLLRLLKRLAAERDVMHVLCEGGARLAGRLLKAGLVDELVLFYAPSVMGDARALPGVVGTNFKLATMPRFSIEDVRLVGEDVMVRARRAKETSS